MTLILSRDDDQVPAYDVLRFDNGEHIGLITIFPDEGPVGSIEAHGKHYTVSDASLIGVLGQLKKIFAGYDEDYVSPEDIIPDEDGSEAYALMLENKSEEWAQRDPEYYS